MNNTTEGMFNYFVKRCNYWKEKFGLMEWNLSFRMTPLDRGKLAEVIINYPGKYVEVCLSAQTHTKFGKEDINKAAMHEMVHILTHPMFYMASTRYIGPDEIQEQYESDTVRMTNIITGLLNENKAA